MASSVTRVAHVFRRLGFGPSPADLEAGIALGPEGLIAELLSRPVLVATPDNPLPWGFGPSNDTSAAGAFSTRMVELMAFGPSEGPFSSIQPGMASYNPVQERVAWILHGLLVTAMTKTVYFRDMKAHVGLLREAVGGSYRELLLDISTRAAMLKYLNGDQNSRTHPNENFARELMELFSLGRKHPLTGEDNYDQADITEIARALTGWQYNWTTGLVAFNPSAWDPGNKTFRGQSLGAAGLVEVIDAISSHPSFPYYVSKRFYQDLVGLDPSADTLSTLAAAFGPQGDLAALVAAIVWTPEFLSDEAIFSKVKQPVDLVASAARFLGHSWLSSSTLNLPYHLSLLQQEPLLAPNVSGWPRGDHWLGSSNLTTWSNLSGLLVMTGFNSSGTVVGPICPTLQALFDQGPAQTAAARALAMAGLDNASPSTLSKLGEYAQGGPWTLTRAGGLLCLLLLSPEFLVQ